MVDLRYGRRERSLRRLDALMSLAEMTALRERVDDDAARRTEALAGGADVVRAVARSWERREAVPAPVILLVMGLVLQQWTDGAWSRLLRWPDPADLTELVSEDDDGVVLAGLGCLRALARLELVGPDDDDGDDDDETDAALGDDLEQWAVADALTQVRDSMGRLSDVLAAGGRAQDAARCWAVAANFAVDTEEKRSCLERALSHYASAGDHPQAALVAATVAVVVLMDLQEVDQPTPRVLREALDAVERAARLAHRGGDRIAAEMRNLLDLVARTPLPRSTRALVALAMDGDGPWTGAESQQVEGWRHYVRPVWDLAPEELMATLLAVGALAVDLENARFPLEEGEVTTQHETDWTSMTFRHGRYLRAVPHGRTLRREGHLDNILLELMHETTHVLTLIGHIGLTLLAARAAALQLEGYLWTYLGEDDREATQGTFVAPLRDHHVLALAQAEQSVDVARKLQVLQGVWTPWMEGLAVFGELAEDPHEGASITTVGSMVMHLIDVGIPPGADDVETGHRLREEARLEAEKLYADIQRRAGRSRLRTYLVGSWTRYGPGYILVRSVLAAWRSTLGRPLTGTDAMKVLLHASRWSTDEAVPDLRTPVADFEREATAGMVAWVRALAALSRDDLELALAASHEGRVHGWHRVRPDTEIGDDLTSRSLELYHDRLRQAWGVLRGAAAPPDRVADADEDCRAMMSMIADALTQGQLDEDLADDFLQAFDASNRFLVLGEVDAPFWVLRPSRQLACVLRTTEADKDHGGPGYDLVMTPLDDESLQGLLEELDHRPAPRMRIRRLAELSPAADGLGGGNLLSYRLGGWHHVEPRGLMFGAEAGPDLVEAVEDALDASPRLELEAEVATGTAGARRTSSWIDLAEGWSVGDEAYPVEAWASSVRDLAAAVVDGATSDAVYRRAGRAALEHVLGDAGVELADEGLLGSVYSPEEELTPLVTALFASARAPATSQWLDDLTPEEPAHGWWAQGQHGWDIRPPDTSMGMP